MKQQIIIEIISFLFIALFVYAAVSKLLDVEEFRVQIGNSPLLTNISGLVAWAIPMIEIIISLLLAIRRFRMIGLYAAFSMMIMFTAYIVAILTFAQKIPCSCGGVLEKLGWTEHLIFNTFFIFLAVIGIMILSNYRDFKNTVIG